ncbi:MAG TPA: DUF1501 domain-containing protein [Burkholderiaceae bacterium]
MKRRDFLQTIAAGAALLPFGRQAWAASLSEGTPTKHKMIVVMLRGAVDGLSVVAPYADANYYRLRPSIAVPQPGQENGAIDLDGYFGLNPALASMRPLWQSGKLAFIHASGSPDPTRSHFDAQDYLESGTPGRKATQDGWMNRMLGGLPGPVTPTRAVAIGPLMPRILSGHVTASNIASGAAGSKATALDRPQVGDAFDKLYSGNDKYSKAYQQSQQTHQEVMISLDDEMEAANGGAPLPNGFPDDAERLARLMRKDANIQLAFLAVGGWDTHANQGTVKGQLANRLNPLGLGLANLAQQLGPMFDDTTIVVMSEFGRTARQNGNNGTDHGHGNVMWVLGGKVNGGRVYADWQGMEENRLHEGRDLPVTTDFRQVLAQIGERHLRLPDAKLAQVFPDFPGNLRADLIRS